MLLPLPPNGFSLCCRDPVQRHDQASDLGKTPQQVGALGRGHAGNDPALSFALLELPRNALVAT
jgi:hypothetical protein